MSARDDGFRRLIEQAGGLEKDVLVDAYRHLKLGHFIGGKGRGELEDLDRHYPAKHVFEPLMSPSGEYVGSGRIPAAEWIRMNVEQKDDLPDEVRRILTRLARLIEEGVLDRPYAYVGNGGEQATGEGRWFGHVPGQPVGAAFASRKALAESGVHRPLQHGISGSEAEGADSIVVSGGYEDDEDYGDLIVYTGAGGRDPATGQQIADQEFARQNLALVRSEAEGLPVRVIRGSGGDPTHSPASGFRYEGLYRVEEAWQEPGRSGFLVCRYRLVRLGAGGVPVPVDPETLPLGPAPRAEANVQRLVRNTAVSRRVKELHGYTCQVCGEVIAIVGGAYAEGAHIRPLGRPHDGPDVASNVLCLCPNDHVRFEFGTLVIEDDLTIVDRTEGRTMGVLRTARGHTVDPVQLAYHRQHFDLIT